MGLNLYKVSRTAPELFKCLKIHYSKPEGFVGRNTCYAIHWNNTVYGFIVGGLCTKFLPGRN